MARPVHRLPPTRPERGEARAPAGNAGLLRRIDRLVAANGPPDVVDHDQRAEHEQEAAGRPDDVEGVHRLDRLHEGIFGGILGVIGPPHQALQDARHPHRGDVEQDAKRRDPEMPFDQALRIEPAAMPEPRHQAVDRAEADKGDPTERAGMDMADGPVGVMRQRIDRLDAHQRPLEGRCRRTRSTPRGSG